MSLSTTSTCVGGRYARPAMSAAEPDVPPAPTVRPPEKRWAECNPFGLTGRECQVIEALIKGQSQVQIADRFFVSIDTVNKHVENAKHKAQAATTLELAIKYDRAVR